MNGIILLDSVSLAAVIWVLYSVWRNGHIAVGAAGRILMLFFLLALALRDLSNMVQWSYLGAGFRQYEDFFELLVPLLWVFFFYGLIQELARRDLKSGEARQKAILNSLESGVAVIDAATHRIMDVNPAAARMIGLAPEAIIGRECHRFICPHDSGVCPILDSVGRIEDKECVLLTADGTEIPIHKTGVLADLDGRPHFVETFVDIRERKKADAALRYSEERFRTTFNIAAVGLAHVAPDGRWLRVNQRLCDILGYSEEELLAMHFHDITHPDDLAAEVDHLRQLLNDHQADYSLEKRYIRKDGTPVWVNRTVALARDEAGRPDYLIAAVEDISDRKAGEAIRSRLEEQLRQAQKMEAVGQLAGGVGHDFNNILHAILAHSELALMELDEGHESYEEVRGIRQAADRAATLVRQLLAFSRRQVLDLKTLDCNELIDGFLKMIRRVIGEDIELEFLSESGLDLVRVDPVQLEQVLMNLCVNARDAMPAGGTVTIETCNVELDEEFCEGHPWARPGRFVCLSVSDTGEGMDEATLDQIFDPFFTTKEVGRGTGLGLATVYGIVAQHDGLIHVQSIPGEGSSFHVYLPRVPQPTGMKEEADAYQPLGGSETILVAEDDDMVRGLMVRVLEGAGYRVLVAKDGREAIDIVEANGRKIDLALLDAVMPHLGGREAHDRIKEVRPDIKVLFCSGYSPDAIHTRFVLDEGMNLIQKPCEPTALLRKVRDLLDAPQNVSR